jgi:hypothetical protein
MAKVKELLEEEHITQHSCVMVRSPQANNVLERKHPTTGNMICTFEVQDREVDKKDPWSGILAAARFAIKRKQHMLCRAQHLHNWYLAEMPC